MEKVFVYGTLKRGHGNHVLLRGSDFLGPSLTKEIYTMYRSGIPFVSKSPGTTRVIGELYNVDELTLNHLDMLEGHPTWYKREQINVDYISNEGEMESTKAWLYFNEEIPAGATIVETGT